MEYQLTTEMLKAYKIPDHSKEPFSKALMVLVRASGITHAELGKALHVSGVTIHNYLHGYRTKPGIDFIRKVSDFFDVKPTYFREYRIYLINEKLYEYPEAIDILFEVLADPKKLISSYKSRKDKYIEGLKEIGINFLE